MLTCSSIQPERPRKSDWQLPNEALCAVPVANGNRMGKKKSQGAYKTLFKRAAGAQASPFDGGPHALPRHGTLTPATLAMGHGNSHVYSSYSPFAQARVLNGSAIHALLKRSRSGKRRIKTLKNSIGRDASKPTFTYTDRDLLRTCMRVSK